MIPATLSLDRAARTAMHGVGCRRLDWPTGHLDAMIDTGAHNASDKPFAVALAFLASQEFLLRVIYTAPLGRSSQSIEHSSVPNQA